MRGALFLAYDIVKIIIPNSRKDDANRQENQTHYKDTMIVGAFDSFFGKLTFTVLTVKLVISSSHREECLHDITQYKRNANQYAFATDIHHSGKHQEKNSGNEKSICYDLNICANVVGKKSAQCKNANRNQRCYTETSNIFN